MRALTPLAALMMAMALASGCSNFSETAEILNPAPAGGIAVIVGPAWEPDITLVGTAESIMKGSAMTVSVNIDPLADSIEWYVDATLLVQLNAEQLGIPVTFGSALQLGSHTLTLIARKGDLIASSQFQFTVNPASS